MKKQDKIALRESILRKTVERWMVVEEETISQADKLIAASQNILVRQVMDMIRRDSEKHREVLKTIQAIQEGTITITHEEMGDVHELLEHHMQIENESIILARTAMENTRHFVIRQLLDYLLQDERKHLIMTDNVRQLKNKLV